MIYASNIVLSCWAVLDMGENDILVIALLKYFKKKKGSRFPAYVDVETHSILRASCRHPLYSSMFIYNTFGPTVYTVTRLAFIITIWAFVYIGAFCEEKG